MRLSKIGNLLLLLLIMASCSNTNFMGARLYGSNGFYVKRLYVNPRNPSALPSGTAIYKEAREHPNKFIIKYYIEDQKGSKIEIPAKDMWKVRHNGKDADEQDDENLFFYIKNEGSFNKYFAIPANVLAPIKECYENGWCKLYPTTYPETLYVKRSILYQGPTILNEKQKAERAREVMQATPATPPWITPTAQTCTNNGGKMNSRGVCEAKWKAANRICEEMGGRLPTIDELKQVVIECGGTVDVVGSNKNIPGYEDCYRRKGFSYQGDGYLSSTTWKPSWDKEIPDNVYGIHLTDSASWTSHNSMGFPIGFLCHEN